MAEDSLFQVSTPVGFQARVSRRRWETITTTKHPAMVGRLEDVRGALENPDEVRRSRTDSSVYLFYLVQRPGRWICAVMKRLNGEGFLITAYPTDSIKVGERKWNK